MHQSLSHRSFLLRQALVVSGLISVAAIHILDLRGKMEETPYLGFGYILVIVASLLIVERIISGGTQTDFLAAAALCSAVLVGFVINRTVGMPGAKGDIGNWWEPLGLLSLVVEALVVWHALRAVQEGVQSGSAQADASAGSAPLISA